MKKVFLVLGTVGLLAMGAIPASAHMLEYQGGARAGLEGDNVSWIVRISCQDPDTWQATFRLRQGTNVDTDASSGDCSGSGIFQLKSPIFEGGYHLGTARANVTFNFSDGNTFTNARDVKIVSCNANGIFWC